MLGSVQADALAMLKAVYEQTGGNIQDIASSEDAAKCVGLDTKSARAALGYLFGKGLLEDTREVAELPAVFMTAGGVDAIEGALANPSMPTRNFPAVNIIKIQNFNGGAIQQATVASSQHVQSVVQSAADLAQMAQALALIRAELLKSAVSADDYVVVGRIAEAEQAAANRDSEKTSQIIRALGAAGRAVLDAGVRAGAEVAVSYIKAQLGLP